MTPNASLAIFNRRGYDFATWASKDWFGSRLARAKRPRGAVGGGILSNVLYKKYFPVHATPRGAHGSYKKKSVAATNSRKNYKKKLQKKTGGELICKNFGVNGNLSAFFSTFASVQVVPKGGFRKRGSSHEMS